MISQNPLNFSNQLSLYFSKNILDVLFPGFFNITLPIYLRYLSSLFENIKDIIQELTYLLSTSPTNYMHLDFSFPPIHLIQFDSPFCLPKANLHIQALPSFNWSLCQQNEEGLTIQFTFSNWFL